MWKWLSTVLEESAGFLRKSLNEAVMKIVAINDMTDDKTLAHLLKYDSVFGNIFKNISHINGFMQVDTNKTNVTALKYIKKLSRKALGIDLLLKSTGLFTKRAEAEKHLKAGAKKMLISASSTDPDVTIVLGVNEGEYDHGKHHIISNASCTTNCVASLAKVLHDQFKILKGNITTIHTYINDQRILDLLHKDLPRAKTAGLSMIPTSTGATRVFDPVIKDVKGKLHANLIQLSTPYILIADIEDVVKKNLIKVLSWYDNKWACSCHSSGLITLTKFYYFYKNKTHIVSASHLSRPKGEVIQNSNLNLTRIRDNVLLNGGTLCLDH